MSRDIFLVMKMSYKWEPSPYDSFDPIESFDSFDDAVAYVKYAANPYRLCNGLKEEDVEDVLKSGDAVSYVDSAGKWNIVYKVCEVAHNIHQEAWASD